MQLLVVLLHSTVTLFLDHGEVTERDRTAERDVRDASIVVK